MADAEVAEKLYQRACGYSHPGVKIMQYEGQPIEVEYIQHYPPDTQAASLWLRNRQPAKWRDVQKGERDHTTAGTLSIEEQDRLAKEQMAKFWKPVLELEAIQLAARAEQERQD